ncbi:MAG: metal ABC transporter ATP-binding protein [Anaerolineae bacterium]|nr:metal ABC transporter ATP-binding protein [Anaerolineae bacterium]MDQ7034674.1 metal ABC transporter ATP-binding protein [Anaerolineae bacterium]
MINTMPDTILSVQHLSIDYDGTTPALNNVSFEICAGDKVAMIGPNGAGKSTLMKAIMGLIPTPRSSKIVVDRHRLGYVPQHQTIDWSFPVTVRDVVIMGLTRQIGWLRFPSKKHWQQVDTALERVALSDYGQRQISELSGGQQQRVFIARALGQQAELLLLDEPFAGVDMGAQSDLLQVIDELNQDGLTILLSTHDLTLAFSRFTKVLALNHELVAFGSPDIVSQSSANFLSFYSTN